MSAKRRRPLQHSVCAIFSVLRSLELGDRASSVRRLKKLVKLYLSDLSPKLRRSDIPPDDPWLSPGTICELTRVANPKRKTETLRSNQRV